MDITDQTERMYKVIIDLEQMPIHTITTVIKNLQIAMVTGITIHIIPVDLTLQIGLPHHITTAIIITAITIINLLTDIKGLAIRPLSLLSIPTFSTSSKLTIVRPIIDLGRARPRHLAGEHGEDPPFDRSEIRWHSLTGVLGRWDIPAIQISHTKNIWLTLKRPGS